MLEITTSARALVESGGALKFHDWDQGDISTDTDWATESPITAIRAVATTQDGHWEALF